MLLKRQKNFGQTCITKLKQQKFKAMISKTMIDTRNINTGCKCREIDGDAVLALIKRTSIADEVLLGAGILR